MLRVCPVMLHSQLLCCFAVAVFVPMPNFTGLRSKKNLNAHTKNPRIKKLYFEVQQPELFHYVMSKNMLSAVPMILTKKRFLASVEAALSEFILDHPWSC